VANAFSRTLGSLDALEGRTRWALIVVPCLSLVAFAAWLVLARVAVFELSTRARLEVDRAAHPVETPVAGRVLSSQLTLDRAVRAGDVLLVLDAEREQLALDGERKHGASLRTQLTRMNQEIAASDAATRAELATAAASLGELRAREQGAQASSGFSRVQAERLRALGASRDIADLQVKEAEAREALDEANQSSLAFGKARLGREREARGEEGRARLERLSREAAALWGDIEVSDKRVETLEREIAQRTLRAPVDGRVGQVASIVAGMTLSEGERVAVIVPAGQLRVVAAFPVETAVGRVRAGQKARVRFDGFPFTAYGSLAARVVSVGSEAEQGQVRVELAVHEDPKSAIPMQHGLTGQVEVQIENVAPIALLLRLSGRTLAGARPFPMSGGRGDGSEAHE
jgi:multidrug resistance efflux pump